MVKFTIDPITLLYSGDNCYVTVAAFKVISQSSYSLLSWGLGHLRCLKLLLLDKVMAHHDEAGLSGSKNCNDIKGA